MVINSGRGPDGKTSGLTIIGGTSDESGGTYGYLARAAAYGH